MNISLNIQNDAELRAYVKDLIKGQVLSIVRDEILGFVKDELTRNLKNSTSKNFDYMVQNAINKSVENILYREHDVSSWGKFFQPIVEKKVDAALGNRDFKGIVDQIAKEKIKQLIG